MTEENAVDSDKIEGAETYRCECLDCGHTQNSKVHCDKAKCAKCGSTKMRRASRPGAGKEKRNSDNVDDEIPATELEDVELAKWTTKYINSLPNSSFAAIEPDYLNGKTDDKNARHLPYKDKNGKVDLPHLRNARARMNQIKPVTKSISTEALRAKAKRVLDAAAKKHLKPKEMIDELNETGMFTLSTGRKIEVELIEDKGDHTLMKFELIDNDTYNGVYFSKEAIEYQYEQFQKKEFTVSHGMDHSRKTLDQLGEVVEMKLEYEGKDNSKVRCFIISKIYKETKAQEQAHILLDQGLLNYISGGWSGRIIFDFEIGRFEIQKPLFRESSSTPTPAKRDATVQNVLDVILSLTQAPDLEDDIMSEEPVEEQVIEPSEEGEEIEQSAELKTLKEEMQAEVKRTKELNDKIVAERTENKKAELMKRAKELGLSEELFTDSTPKEMELALTAAKELQVSELAKREPEFQLGGEDGSALQDGSPEMIAELEKKYYDWGDLGDEEVVF